MIPVPDIIRPCVVMIMALKIESYLMALRENIFELIDSLLRKYQEFLVPICSDLYIINVPTAAVPLQYVYKSFTSSTYAFPTL